MAKKEATLLQLVLALTIFSCIAAVGLAAVYSVTKGPIEAVQVKKKEAAIQKVLPGFKGDIKEIAEYEIESGKDPILVNLAYQDGQFFGAAVQTYTNNAFGGRFDIMVGFDTAGTILGTEVLKASETPGLGDKINKDKSDFALQFNKKNPADFRLKVIKDGGDVDAITAATISSRAYCDAVERASIAYNKIKENIHE